MVSEQGFDWIFFAIVGIPLVLAFVELFVPSLSERLIREPARRHRSISTMPMPSATRAGRYARRGRLIAQAAAEGGARGS